MVFFSCEGCNETLKKAQAEGHIRRCGCPVSCVDCSQVFPGMTFQQHTSCISEAEKYEKSLYKGPKGGGKKKRDPQAEWMDLIGAAAAEVAGGGAAASPLVRGSLQRMADLGNVPRNEKKFKNFLSNSLRIHRPAEQDELWQYLRKRLEAATATAATTAAAPEEQAESSPPEQPKGEQQAESRSKKRKEASSASACSNGERAERKGGDGDGDGKKQKAAAADADEAEEGFAWDKAIKKAAKAAGKNGVGFKSLRKEVVAAALAAGEGGGGDDDGKTKKALKKLFKAKLGAVPGVVVRPDQTVVYDKKAAKA